MHNIKKLTPFSDIQVLLQNKPPLCIELVEQCLVNIHQQAFLNAFVRTYTAEALQQARQVTNKLERQQAGKLAGLVVGLKDLLCYKDHPVQGCSKILEGFVAQFHATAVQRILAADAIIIGHQNCDEFGMGSSNEKSAFGVVRNAIDPNRVPGGSSGGSAVGVQAGMCHIALGTDTGGSVRQPASFCGIVGLKPTYGTIPRHGMLAYASSFDTIGILSQNVTECALVLDSLAGPDEFDSTASRRTDPTYTAHLKTEKRFKIAYLQDTLAYGGLQTAIRLRTTATIDHLKKQGHQVEAVTFPLLPYTLSTYYVLTTAEASTNLARLDGVRYGYRSSGIETIEDLYTKTRSEGFGQEVKRRILLGAFVLSAHNYEHCYIKAQKIRRLIHDQLKEFLYQYDFIILPTTPTTAFEIGCNVQDPLAMYWADMYTTLASIVGVPAISIPNGVDENNLPIGLQIIANSFREAELLGFANYLMQTQVLHA